MKDKKLEFSFTPTPQAKHLDPKEPLLYFGVIVRGTQADFEKIKDYVLDKTDVRLIYQHSDVRYLKMAPVDPQDD